MNEVGLDDSPNEIDTETISRSLLKEVTCHFAQHECKAAAFDEIEIMMTKPNER